MSILRVPTIELPWPPVVELFWLLKFDWDSAPAEFE